MMSDSSITAKTKTAVVVPNWNGRDCLAACLDSLLKQTAKCEVVVVENGSTDGSAEFIRRRYPQVTLLINERNLGFAGGVNTGIRYALKNNFDFVALFNNDASADKGWLDRLIEPLLASPATGIATGKFLNSTGGHLDSTGDMYTTWGLAYPRGRGEAATDKYDRQTHIFGATGGASLYRLDMLRQIGLFDEDFFAYYEDVDLSWRAQLAGWKVRYVPSAKAYHQIGATSSKIKGFTTFHTIKNLPWLLWKNVPRQLLPVILPRFCLAHGAIVASAIARGHGWYAFKGAAVSLALLPKKLMQRRKIQNTHRTGLDYIKSMLIWDLPPNAFRLRNWRNNWRKLKRRPKRSAKRQKT